jgi:hypothetical protein
MGLLARIFANEAVKAAIQQIAEIVVLVAANIVVALITDSRSNQKQIKNNNRKNNVQLLHTNQANS